MSLRFLLKKDKALNFNKYEYPSPKDAKFG